ncbi:extracellular solute-binding protein [Asaia krungthepensis]|uniref:extracellular solute-binding protein n=1 Tax=Asaia krungthepensis TaxID=220990 RepID=UPI00222FBB7D|nr:extracellular solute-binding protein [Asaia krungthepensis]
MSRVLLVTLCLPLLALPAHATTHHAHHSAHHAHAVKPAKSASPKSVLAVVSGSIDAHSLLMPDQPYPLKEWDGSLSALRDAATARVSPWLAAMVDNTTLYAACRDGIVQTLPAPPQAAPARPAPSSPCGIQAGEESIVLAWDRGRLGDAAPDWGDFWDIARHPGKRALRLDPRGTLEIALMADGVAPGDVYTILATPAGVDRAFRKLEQLRPYLVWWRTPEEASRIMNSGAALMLSTPYDRLADLGPRISFAAQWRQSLRQKLSWAIPRNVPAEQTDTVIRMLRDQTPLHDDTQDAPQDGRDVRVLSMNDTFWALNFDALQKRLQAWLTSAP